MKNIKNMFKKIFKKKKKEPVLTISNIIKAPNGEAIGDYSTDNRIEFNTGDWIRKPDYWGKR